MKKNKKWLNLGTNLIIFALVIIIKFNLAHALAISPGIINLEYQQERIINLSFKVVNLEKENISLSIIPSSPLINIERKINLSDREKERIVNFTISLPKNLKENYFEIYVIEEKKGDKIFAKEGVKLMIRINKVKVPENNEKNKIKKSSVENKSFEIINKTRNKSLYNISNIEDYPKKKKTVVELLFEIIRLFLNQNLRV